MPASTLMPCSHVEVVAAVSFRKIAVGIVKIPLAARGAGVIARRGLGIQTELRHHPRSNIVIVKIAADAQLGHVHFIGSENLARTANRVVLGVSEVVDVVDVGPISGVKNFVSSGTSFVRGLPFSHVKSAKANGCAFSGFTVPVRILFHRLRMDTGSRRNIGDRGRRELRRGRG